MIKHITPKVLRVLQEEEISMEELEHMVTHAAPATSERGNRRFHRWLFKIKGDSVEDMQMWEPTVSSIKGSMDMTVHEDCTLCDGEGCFSCGWIGQVKVTYYKV